MTVPNPQYAEIDRVMSGVPLFHYHLHWKTKYFFDTKEVICLGLHHGANAGVAIFGEWEGPESDKPVINVELIKKCSHAFLLRSATEQESVEHGCRKVVVHLEVARMDYIHRTDCAEKIAFQPKGNTGFYNPVL